MPTGNWSDSREHGIVEDGRRRVYDANVDRVRAEVEAEYADEMREAGPWGRALLLQKIEREIRRRMRKIAPPDGLY